MGKHPHKALFRGEHAYDPEAFTSMAHAVAYDRFRTMVENEIRTWGRDSELRRTFIDALAAAWRGYNDQEPSNIDELKQFVDEYVRGVGEQNIWRLAFVEGLTTALLEEGAVDIMG